MPVVPSRLFIHAPNVHTGGGRSLLLSILASIPKDLNLELTVDDRLDLPSELLIDKTVKRVSASLFNRMEAEIWLAKNVEPNDSVLCFGNLPPLIKVRGRVVVFVQNRFLVDDVTLGRFSVRSKIRIIAERCWLKLRLKNVDEFIVQTPSMEKLLETMGKSRIKIRILPFYKDDSGHNRALDFLTNRNNKEHDFVYVASGEPHKNHRRLIEAWCVLAREGTRPSLALTLDEKKCSDLLAWIEHRKEQYLLNVKNFGSVDFEQIHQLYDKAGALIYPSTIESFGLPLVEARQAGLSILASELDYVRDVVDPEESFDPNTSISIARAVKRYLGVGEKPLPLCNIREFLEAVTGQGT